jgi:hypothetical protein
MWRLKADWLRLCLPPLLLVTLFVVTGLRGINFGEHWDERDSQLNQTRAMLANGVFLPPEYNYPGVGKMLVAVPALDDGLRALAHGASLREVFGAMVSAIDAPDYLLQARSVFLVVSALGIIWVYLAVWVLTRRWWQATLAAAMLGLSWELAYHARWAVNDCILAQFSALCLLLLALYHRTGKSRWLWFAAISTGLAAGTKYPGVLLLVPVMLYAALRTPATVWQRAASVLAVGALSVASYLVTTPGTVLAPLYFIEGLRVISVQYTTGHYGHTVPAGFPHLWVLLRYLSLNFFSPYTAVSVALFAPAIAGAALYLREDRKLAALLIGFPLLFATLFCWKYRVFFARNYLLLAPFVAVLSARGLAEALLRARWPAARLALMIALGCALAANAGWLIFAGESIRHRDEGAAALKAMSYVRDHPGTRFRISPKVASLAAERGLALPPNSLQADAEEVVFFAKVEGPPPGRWLANDPWLTRAVFGPWDVNFNYYPPWQGPDRVVVMTVDKARNTGAPLAQ